MIAQMRNLKREYGTGSLHTSDIASIGPLIHALASLAASGTALRGTASAVQKREPPQEPLHPSRAPLGIHHPSRGSRGQLRLGTTLAALPPRPLPLGPLFHTNLKTKVETLIETEISNLRSINTMY